MELVNDLYKIKTTASISKETLESLLQLLAPFAPHITEELWQQFGHTESIHRSDWPTWDEKYLQSATMTIAVQVNGKLRSEVVVPTDAKEETVLQAAQSDQKVKAQIAGKQIVKTIYVPGKIANLVVK